MSKIGQQIVAGFKEFTNKLRKFGPDNPIDGTRVMTCTDCENDPAAKQTCPRCGGKGFLSRRVKFK